MLRQIVVGVDVRRRSCLVLVLLLGAFLSRDLAKILRGSG